MGYFNTVVLFALVCAVAVVVASEEPRRSRRALPSLNLDDLSLKSANWTTCDITTVPVISCGDCKTRLICKPIGGLLISCLNPYRPYCVNGICSPIPTAECAEED